MKLIYKLALRTLLIMLPVMVVWGALFYNAMMNEVLDEMDDNLEDYSEMIIRRALGGDMLPSVSNGSNNQYYLTAISAEEALATPQIVYADSMVYIIEKGEREPARILKTIFVNDMGQYFRLTVATPSIDKYDLIESIFYWIVILYALLLVTVVSINTIVFYRSLKPLYVLLNWLDNYKIGKKNEPLVNETNVSEFRKLNEAAINNAVRHESYNEMQKQFISNASHEIQTPVAICMNRIEMMMDDDSLSEHCMEELGEIHATLQHISKLNKSLLLISRIDNGQYSETVDVDINQLLKKYIDNLGEVYSYMNITVEYRQHADLVLKMNETLAQILVTNLLKNAFIHNVENGKIVVSVDSTGFFVSNTGTDHALDADLIFTRFYQGSKKEGSTGLGLAITAAICKLFELTVRYKYEEGMHTFIVRKDI